IAALLPSVYYVNDWSIGWITMGQAVNGDVTDLLALLDEFDGRSPGGYDHEIEAFNAITCADTAVPTDIASYDRAAAQSQARDPEFGDAAVYGTLPCAYWHVRGPAPAVHSVSGTPPIVLVGATHDPATPYAWSVAMQKQIAGSVLLTRDGYGHTSYENSGCIRARVDPYLTDLTVPPAGLTCTTD
ncbi:MAG TPA: alpha/beta hydrolase, partial [Candidatus Dormibacteraeota bacterium]|nr:alpha/beta hydrolase [Candidatus Dormibacteraeota bacterium]